MARTTAASGALAARKAGILAGGGVLLALVLGLLAGLPAQAHADTAGAFEIVATDPGQPLDGGDYSYSGNVLEIKTDKPVTVSMANPGETTKTDRIVVPMSNKSANVTLAGVKIDVSGDDGSCAFAIESRVSVNVTLAKGSANSLVSGGYRSGLEVESGASVAIGGEGALEAKCFSEGDAHGTGIGGGDGVPDVSVSIAGGAVSASCESVGSIATGAGIGGGSFGSRVNVAITGGVVTASCKAAGDARAAGIGSGYDGDGSVKISGGTVIASSEGGSNSGNGIGGHGGHASTASVSISGGRIKAESGSGAAIGPAAKITGGLFAPGSYSDGKVYGVDLPQGRTVRDNPMADKEAYPFAVTVPAGDFAVMGGTEGVDYSYAGNVLQFLTDTPMAVSMATPDATTRVDRIAVPSSNATPANVTLAGVKIDASGDADGNGCAFAIEPGASASITLAEGSVNSLASGNKRAGLEVPDGASVSIGGEGSLEAKCESSKDNALGAGIGGGGGDSAGNIEITGGTVTALCKSFPFDALGAGIGGGYVGSGGDIKISGGTVTASCESVDGTACVAGIGGYAGSSIDIAISGGRIKVPGTARIDRTAKITGGLFADGEPEDNKVYGVTPVEGFAVYDSGDADYPFTVAGLTGDFKVEGGEPGTDYSYEYKSSTLKILTGKSMTVSMRDGVAQTERDRIVVPVNTNADVALAGVDVRLSGDDDCAFQIELGASAKVTLAADGNSLVSGANRAGLEVSDGASVVIDGKGSLTAKCFSEGFAYGAGIGGGYGGSGGIVKIAGGMVTASCEGVGDYGSSYGAGIGGGSNGSGGSVEITGGEVNASCDGELQANGAGIGAGLIGSNINVKVSGGTVNASCVSLGGPSNGAGIGGGSSGSRDSNVAVSISGGTVTASCENAYGSVYGAGIGGGYYGPNDVLSISGGYIRASGYGSGIGSGERGSVDMSITGGLFADGKVDGGPDGNKVYGVPPAEGFAVYASGDTGYPYAVAGLAGDFQVEGGVRGTDYSYEYKSSTLKILTDVPLSVSMRDGVEQTKRDRIEMFESEVANVTLAGVRIDASGDEYGCAFAMGPRSLANVTLAKGSANSLVSGASRAGLEVGDGASVAIGGEGFLEAKCFSEGDAKGAGIGGCYGATDVSVSISGGTVSASCKGVNGLASGAGIGGGQSGSGGSIEITGGEVTASCESSEYAYGAGIGAGYGGSVVGVDISGGRIKAVSGLVAIDPAAKITGGAFASSDADADVAADEVCGVPVGTQDAPRAVIANPDPATSEAYPVAVCEKRVYAPTLAPKRDFVYSGEPLVAADFELSVATPEPTQDELAAAASFESKEASSPDYAPTMPVGAGLYDVRATLAKIVCKEGGVPVCYVAEKGAATGKASIAPRQISVSSASVASKTYDGTTDAKVEEVRFDNLVDGESLTMGTDFTATGAFESSAAGKGKRVLVEVSLEPESPVCKNYVLAEGGSSVETTGDIVQSGASLDLSVGGAGGGQGPSFLYGETMSFTVTPQAAHSLAFRSAAEPTLQLFVVGADGSEIPLCEPVEGVAEGKPTTVYYDTSKKLLPVGENIVRVRVSGMANLQEAFEDVQVLVKPKGVELFWSGLDDRVYGDGAQVSAQLVGALPTDDVRVDVSGGAETEAGGPYAATASLAGEDAPFYAIEGSAVADYSIAKVPAFDLSVPVDMKRLQPGDEASVDVAALLPEAARDASFEVASLTTEGLVSAEVDAAGILSLTSDAPAGAQRDEVEVRLSNMANCEDSKVVVTVAYVDKPVAKISNATAANDLVYNGSPQVGFAGKPVASFDGGTYEGDFKLSYEGVGDTAYGPSADAPTRAGDYVATLSVPGDEPSCAGSISLGFSIGRAPLAVTAHDATATYGEQGADAGVEFEGFVPGEGPSNLSGSLALAIEGYEAGSPAGFYPIVPSGLSSGDYLISFVPGRMEVLPKALSAKVDAGDPSASRPYDGTAAFFGVALSLEGVLPGDEVLAVADGAAERALVGDDLGFEALSVGLEGADAASYSLSPADVEGRVSISRVSLTVRAADASMVAGGQLPELGFELSGLAASDEVLAPPALSVEGDTSAPGSCSIVPSGVSVTNQDCYDVAYENGTLTVLAPEPDGGDGDGDGSGGSGDGEVPGSGGASGEDGSQPGEGSGSGGVPRPLPAPDGARQADAVLSPTGDPLSAASFVAGAIALVAGLAAALAAGRRARR